MLREGCHTALDLITLAFRQGWSWSFNPEIGTILIAEITNLVFVFDPDQVCFVAVPGGMA